MCLILSTISLLRKSCRTEAYPHLRSLLRLKGIRLFWPAVYELEA